MDRLKYIFSFILIAFSLLSFAQDDNLYVIPVKKDPLKFLGVKLGVNIGRFADFQFKPERFSYEASLDFNLSNKYYGIIEAGYSEINLEKTSYHYKSDGNFVKLGLDYNMLKKQPTDYLGMGFRLGWATFTQSAENFVITNDHWNPFTSSIAPQSHNKYWVEMSFGVKGEVLKNIYLGWSAIVRINVLGGKDQILMPYDIPGYGKGSSSINLGANYYLYYQIPFKRK